MSRMQSSLCFYISFIHLKILVYQVVEIGIYIEHLLRECAKKGKYQQCPRCTEAIGNDFDVHIKLKECSEIKTKYKSLSIMSYEYP